MAMQTLAISQLFIQQLKATSPDIKQVWFVDDAPSAVTFHFRTTILIPPQWLKKHRVKGVLLMKPEHEEISKLKPMHSYFCLWEIMTPINELLLAQGLSQRSMPPTRYSPGLRRWHACQRQQTPKCMQLMLLLHLVMHLIPTIDDPTGLGHPPNFDISIQRICSVFRTLEGELLSLPVRLVGIGLANQATSSPHTLSTSK